MYFSSSLSLYLRCRFYLMQCEFILVYSLCCEQMVMCVFETCYSSFTWTVGPTCTRCFSEHTGWMWSCMNHSPKWNLIGSTKMVFEF
jgi:hypothetical protein